MANDYVDNKRLFEEMVKYTESYHKAKAEDKQPPRVNNYIGECIWLIANKLSTLRQFASYSYKEEMIGDGIENTLRYLHNFNPEKSKNPFAYFTQIIYYAFLRRIDKEKKQAYIRYKALENAIAMNTLVDMPAEDAQHFHMVTNLTNMDKMNDMADRFETRLKTKKNKAKAAATATVDTFTEEPSNE
jgi:hypothetical protein